MMTHHTSKIVKSLAVFSFLTLITISGNAQTQKRKSDRNNNKVEKKEKREDSEIMEYVSPYNEKYRNVRLHPMMPDLRDVSKYKKIDQAKIRIFYAFNATDITKGSTYDDLQRLEIGNRYIKYYSDYAYRGDSCGTADFIEANKRFHTNYKLETKKIVITLGMRGKHRGWSQYIFSEYFKDLSKNEITEYCRMPSALENLNCYYTEPIPTQEWQIEEESKEIASYTCQKATCHFRGRNYTAWFAIDIPINQGPWKFGGLPGLILKVYDDKKEYVFECVGIEQHSQPYPIIKLENYKLYRKKTFHKTNKLMKSVCENYYQLTGMTNAASQLLFPYNPMELKEK